MILGAGPSGLSFATRLADLGETSFLLLEKEPEAGGLCRSAEVDGSPLDIGGGHFLDVIRPRVLDFLFRFLPEEQWRRFDRKTMIRVGKFEIDYPFESNIWQFPKRLQEEYLDSISRAGCNTGAPMPEKFADWISWKLGDKIAADYMIPYNKKIWSIDLDRLGTYWLYKLPDVSYEDTLWSCKNRKPKGTIPAHAVFLYPRSHGYGEVWRRMAARLTGKILYNQLVESLDPRNLTVCTRDGAYRAKIIVNTTPWCELYESPGLPYPIRAEIENLEYASIQVTYREEKEATPAHWLYLPDEDIPHHRIVCRHNFLAGARGCWSETNSKRVNQAEDKNRWHHVNRYAYPINTAAKPKAVAAILQWGKERAIYGLGRWGEWEHVNSDLAVEKALMLADSLWRER